VNEGVPAKDRRPRSGGGHAPADWVVAVAAAVVTRVAVFAAAGVCGWYLHYRGHHAVVEAGLRGILLRPWNHRDAGWFLEIAASGYSAADPDRTAFFPLYPLLIRVLGAPTGHRYQIAGMVLSLVAYGLAMLVLYRLTTKLTDTRTAAITVVLISVFPTAVVFNAVHSESLFLLLTVTCLWLASDRRWALAGITGLLATLTRGSGIVLLPPLLVLYAQQQGWTWRSIRPSWPRDLRLAWTALIPLGLFAYMGYLWVRFGDARLFSEVERRHWRRALEWPWVDVWRGLHASAATVHSLAAHHAGFWHGLLPGAYVGLKIVPTVFPVLALGFAGCAIALGWRRLPPAFTLFAVLSVLFPLLFPSRLYPLWSVPRFVMVVFPLFIAVAIVLKERPVWRWSLIGLSFVVMLWLTGAFAIGTNAV
jgi:hypothetical protein